MPRLIIKPRDGAEKTVEVAAGLSVMEAIRGAGFNELEAICGGSCSCATCHVYVDPAFFDGLASPTSFEEELLGFSDHRLPTSRLSCQIPFSDVLDGLRVTIAPEE